MLNKKFKAGFAEADITPECGDVELYGQYYRRISEGIHSPLKVVALCLEMENFKAVMVSLDVTGVPDDFYRKIKDKLAGITGGFRDAAVIINATHTHNSPALEWKRDWWEVSEGGLIAEREFRKKVEEEILEAVKEAFDSRRAVGTGCYTAYCPVGHPRRAVYSNGTAEMYGDASRGDFAGMEGGEDSAVEMMYFFDDRKEPLGIIVNAACPSQVMEATRVISSDYTGALREKLKTEFGEGFKTICQVSAAGCQSPRDLTRNKEEIACFWQEEGVGIISNRLLEAAREGFDSTKENVDFEPVMRGESRKLELPRRRVSYRDYVRSKRELNRLISEKDSETSYDEFCGEVLSNEENPQSTPPYDSKLHHFVLIKEQEAVIARYEEQFKEPFVETDVVCLRLGNAAFATNPFELFLSYGQMIKARSRAEHTFVVQLANGSKVYLPTEAAELHRGYGALVMNGEVGSDGGMKLVEETVAIINPLFDENKPAGRES